MHRGAIDTEQAVGSSIALSCMEAQGRGLALECSRLGRVQVVAQWPTARNAPPPPAVAYTEELGDDPRSVVLGVSSEYVIDAFNLFPEPCPQRQRSAENRCLKALAPQEQHARVVVHVPLALVDVASDVFPDAKHPRERPTASR